MKLHLIIEQKSSGTGFVLFSQPLIAWYSYRLNLTNNFQFGILCSFLINFIGQFETFSIVSELTQKLSKHHMAWPMTGEMKSNREFHKNEGGEVLLMGNRSNAHKYKKTNRKRNEKRLGGRGLSLEAFANAKSGPSGYNPSIISEIFDIISWLWNSFYSIACTNHMISWNDILFTIPMFYDCFVSFSSFVTWVILFDLSAYYKFVFWILILPFICQINFFTFFFSKTLQILLGKRLFMQCHWLFIWLSVMLVMTFFHMFVMHAFFILLSLCMM